MTVEYGEFQSANIGGTTHPNKGFCELGCREYVTKIETNVILKWGELNVLGGITIVTNQKSCGHFGADRSQGTLVSLEGHKLLYITGRKGFWFDKLELHFESC